MCFAVANPVLTAVTVGYFKLVTSAVRSFCLLVLSSLPSILTAPPDKSTTLQNSL
jgi:hypothetical protein